MLAAAAWVERIPVQTKRLSARDRMDIINWQARAKDAGYDRLVIQERDDCDAEDVGNFLQIYRRGESWSRFGFARLGPVIRTWSSLTGADTGDFSSLPEAFEAILCQVSAACAMAATPAASEPKSPVVDLAAFRFVRQMGAATA